MGASPPANEILDRRLPALVGGSLPTAIPDGADAVAGATTDAAVAAGAAGTVAAKLRRLTTDLDALLTKAEAIRALLAAPLALDAATLAALESIAADTELPAARLAAHGLALPTAPDVLAVLQGFDGTNLQLLLVQSASARNLRTALYAGTNGPVNITNGWNDVGSSQPALLVQAEMQGKTTSAGGEGVRLGKTITNVAAQAITAGTAVTILTPTSSKKFRVLAWCLSLSVAGSVILKFGAGNTEFLRTPLMAAGEGMASPGMGNGIMPGAANDVLKIEATASGNVSGFIVTMEE